MRALGGTAWRGAGEPHLELLQDDGAVGGAICAEVHRCQLRQPEAADRAGGRAGPDLLRIKRAHRLGHHARPACMRCVRPRAARRRSRRALRTPSEHVLYDSGGSVLLPAGMHPTAFLASLRVSVLGAFRACSSVFTITCHAGSLSGPETLSRVGMYVIAFEVWAECAGLRRARSTHSLSGLLTV